MAGSALRRLAVIGAGQMGRGIAVCGIHDARIQVDLFDALPGRADAAREYIADFCESKVARGKMARDEAVAAMGRLAVHDHLSSVVGAADAVLEAVPESLEIKRDVFRRIEPLLRPEAFLATNTSSISVTALAAATSDPRRVVGMHFFNPVPVMGLVELVPGLQTETGVLDRAKALADQLGKTPVVADDRPGFIANRVLVPYINEAIYALQDGIGSRDDIDTVMRLGTGVPMGPLKLADFIGLDTCLQIMRTLHEGLGDDKYRPAPLLVKYVTAGRLGRKSGTGFYAYQ